MVHAITGRWLEGAARAGRTVFGIALACAFVAACGGGSSAQDAADVTTSDGDASSTMDTAPQDVAPTDTPPPTDTGTSDSPASDAGTVRGVAVGASGTVLRTVNGGATWVVRTTPSSATLNRVDFRVTGTTGRICGDGVILRSTDAGDSWTNEYAHAGYNLQGVRFVDATNGWAVGQDTAAMVGIVLRTTNGGGTYATATIPVTDAHFFSNVTFTDASNGWISGEASDGTSLILHTSNGGTTWATQPVAMPTDGLNNLFFSDAMTGWAASGGQGTSLVGAVIRTTNGGASWSSVVVNASDGFLGLFAVGANDVWVTGGHLDASTGLMSGSIYSSTNGGASYTTRMSSTGSSGVNGAYFISPVVGWACGLGGTIERTADGGATWNPQTSGSTSDLNHIVMGI